MIVYHACNSLKILTEEGEIAKSRFNVSSKQEQIFDGADLKEERAVL